MYFLSLSVSNVFVTEPKKKPHDLNMELILHTVLKDVTQKLSSACNF